MANELTNLTNEQLTLMALNVLIATRVEGAQVVFTSSNPQFAAIEADPEGGPFPALKGHLVGLSQITGKADAIIGPGEKELIILETVETVPGEAVAGTILFSEIKG